MECSLAIHADHLTMTLSNRSAQAIRLWEFHNSWGWFSISVAVRGGPDGPVQHIRRGPREWTKDGPTYFSLLPGGRQEILLDLRDGWWELETVKPALAGWRERPVELRGGLEIEPTPESDRYGVFTGAVHSGWITSSPPHGWLPLEG
jgi:hypothetical protein